MVPTFQALRGSGSVAKLAEVNTCPIDSPAFLPHVTCRLYKAKLDGLVKTSDLWCFQSF